MGFPNGGVQAALPRLRALSVRKDPYVLGVSLGKQKTTPLPEAFLDYQTVMRAVYPYADYLAVNVSSPNTPELRSLQFGRHLEELLEGLVAEGVTLAGPKGRRRPILLKVAPDLTWEELDEILAASARYGVSGIIATNTTVSREGLRSPHREETGGLSGRPLTERSTEVIRRIAEQLGDRLPVIGVGGIFTADDARKKLDAGAVLLQLYTGMVYQGPSMPGRLLRELSAVREGLRPRAAR
jgi:dihydroorotate dehydrogenase